MMPPGRALARSGMSGTGPRHSIAAKSGNCGLRMILHCFRCMGRKRSGAGFRNNSPLATRRQSRGGHAMREKLREWPQNSTSVTNGLTNVSGPNL